MANDDVYNAELLRQLLEYDPATGHMTWRERPVFMFKGHAQGAANAWNKRYAGKPAFPTNPSRGYRSSVIFSVRVMAHRAAWCHYFGSAIPQGFYIDHINGDRADNRIANLRLASASQNAANIESCTRKIRGANFHRTTGKWQASIRIHLGTFETEAEAAQAYETAASKLHGEFYLPNGRRANVSRDL